MLVNHLVISFVAFITKVFEEPRKQITNLFFLPFVSPPGIGTFPFPAELWRKDFLVPLNGKAKGKLFCVRGYRAFSIVIQLAKGILRELISLIGGKGSAISPPVGCSGAQILFAVQEQLAKGILRELVSLIGGKGQPLNRLLGVRG